MCEVQELRGQLAQLMAEIEHDVLNPTHATALPSLFTLTSTPSASTSASPDVVHAERQRRAAWIAERSRAMLQPDLVPPTPAQEILIRQIVAGGLADRVAVRDPQAPRGLVVGISEFT